MKGIAIIFGLAMGVASLFGLYHGVEHVYSGITSEGIYRQHEQKIPILHSIERGIEVKGVENRIEFVSDSLFSHASVNGVTSPTIVASSAEQFLKLVPESESVYTNYEFVVDGYTNVGIKQVYLAFIEGRAGVMTYEESYVYGSKYVFDRFDEGTAFFKKDNTGSLLRGGIFFLMISFFGVVFTIGFFFGDIMHDFWHDNY